MTTKKTTGDGFKAQEAATQTIDAALKAGKESVDVFLKEGTDAAAKGFEKAVTMSRDAAGTAARQFDDVSTAGKSSIQATMASGDAWLSGVEKLSGYATKATQELLNEGIQASQAILGAKNPQEAAQLQTEYMQKGWSRFLDETTKLGELSVQAATGMFEPLNAQIGAAMDRWTKPAA
ncbi:MAG: phasin family protein [Alphaproteobacteria bacterium]|nr:phasin family protein [Alphaproteobacteria bacterium]